MSLPELFVIAVALSMDAFAVSICKGLSMRELKGAAVVGLYFGGFQALMPFIGYLLGYRFQEAITSYDHWIAFILLGVIGFNMIKEALSPEVDSCNASLSIKDMSILAVATSIDALAVGVTFAFLNVRILPAITLIGCTTFLLSIVGVKVGSIFGYKYKARAELAGGLILVLMGCKILIEHLFF